MMCVDALLRVSRPTRGLRLILHVMSTEDSSDWCVNASFVSRACVPGSISQRRFVLSRRTRHVELTHPGSLSLSTHADVREPNEVALGSIPSSVNLPLSTFEKSLSMDEGQFSSDPRGSRA